MFACITVGLYLLAAVVAVRLFSSEVTTVSFDTSYSKIFSKYEIQHRFSDDEIIAPEMSFSPVEMPKSRRATAKVVRPKPAIKEDTHYQARVVQSEGLPFQETISLSPVKLEYEMETVAGLYQEFNYVALAGANSNELKEDKVTTTQSAEAEPEFFTYEGEKEELDTKKTVGANVRDPGEVNQNQENKELEKVKPEEIGIEELVTFDYSKAQADLKSQVAPKVSAVTTQAGALGASAPSEEAKAHWSWSDTKGSKKVDTPRVTTQPPLPQSEKQTNDLGPNTSLVEASPKFYSTVRVGVTGTDLKSLSEESGFEIRFQDDLGESVADHNSGEIALREVLTHARMTRSVVVLKRGFAPTNMDLVFEEGASELKIPLVEERAYNELTAPFESRGALGSVLVELDEKTSTASLDVPYSKVLLLDESMRPVTGDDFTYQLFVGVRAGNALLSYRTEEGISHSRIIHIHENEITFDANLSEKPIHTRVEIVEEDLLGKDLSPLIIGSDEVRIFATEKTSQKLNDHTYKIETSTVNLGGRTYLELSHQQEPVFVGFRENFKLEVPSENFMRHILSRFENSRLGNRCMIQVNLSKKPTRFEVGAESVASSLVTSTQILDADGKFYNSIGEKTQKILVVGENQGSPDINPDSKINLKIEYSDGTTEFLSSYCSPNTYLVEQL
jgi:hypothetical protein